MRTVDSILFSLHSLDVFNVLLQFAYLHQKVPLLLHLLIKTLLKLISHFHSQEVPSEVVVLSTRSFA